MRPEEINEIAIQNGLIRGGRADSLNSAIYRDLGPSGRFVKLRSGFGLREWVNDPALAHQFQDEALEHGLRTWLQSLREVLSQLKAPPPANTLCLWTELCYRLGLREEARKIFHLVVDDQADPWLLSRARRIYRLCQDEHE
jgi:hypothetical protein